MGCSKRLLSITVEDPVLVIFCATTFLACTLLKTKFTVLLWVKEPESALCLTKQKFRVLCCTAFDMHPQLQLAFREPGRTARFVQCTAFVIYRTAGCMVHTAYDSKGIVSAG